jgi:sodium pump decarboxylase gamma subunit
MFGDHISISQALFVTLLSMGTVFVILAVIAFLLGYFEHLFSGAKKEKVEKEAKPALAAAEAQGLHAMEEENDPAIVAVITAAILASQTTSYPIRISKIRRVGAAQSNWQNQGNE